MVDKSVALRDHNQVIRNKHNHTSNPKTWEGTRIQSYSSHVPTLGNQPGIYVKCECGEEAWLGLSAHRHSR